MAEAQKKQAGSRVQKLLGCQRYYLLCVAVNSNLLRDETKSTREITMEIPYTKPIPSEHQRLISGQIA